MKDQPKFSVVVRIDPIGDLKVMCYTSTGVPAIYADAVSAEVHATQLREAHPDYIFRAIDFKVL